MSFLQPPVSECNQYFESENTIPTSDIGNTNHQNYPSTSTSHNLDCNDQFENNHDYITEDISNNYVLPSQEIKKNNGHTAENEKNEVSSVPTNTIKNQASTPNTSNGSLLNIAGNSIPFIDTSKLLEAFWVHQKQRMLKLTNTEMKNRCGHMPLPMARVKKIMRIDDDVRNLMIAGDAPLFLATAAEFFIEEVTTLSWHVVEESRRRTMQKSDVVTALQRNDQFDFLIDLIPRDRNYRRQYPSSTQTASTTTSTTTTTAAEQSKSYNLTESNSTINHVNISHHHQQHPVSQQTGRNTQPHIVQVQGQSMPYFITNDLNVNGQIYSQNGEELSTITIDEHGHPVGELPPGIQIVLQNPEENVHNNRSTFQIATNENNVAYQNIENFSRELQNNSGIDTQVPQYRIIHLASDDNQQQNVSNNNSAQ